MCVTIFEFLLLVSMYTFDTSSKMERIFQNGFYNSLIYHHTLDILFSVVFVFQRIKSDVFIFLVNRRFFLQTIDIQTFLLSTSQFCNREVIFGGFVELMANAHISH